MSRWEFDSLENSLQQGKEYKSGVSFDFLPASAGKAGKLVTRGHVLVLVTHLLLKHVKSM